MFGFSLCLSVDVLLLVVISSFILFISFFISLLVEHSLDATARSSNADSYCLINNIKLA